MRREEMERLFHVEQATAEIENKPAQLMDVEAAFTWAGRAVASYRKYRHTGELGRRDKAVEYLHEALEHAALAGSDVVELISTAVAEEVERLGVA